MSEARGQVRAEITEVLSKRWAFLQEQLSADQRGQAAPTLVESLVAAMRQQAADAGLTFDACAAPSAE